MKEDRESKYSFSVWKEYIRLLRPHQWIKNGVSNVCFLGASWEKGGYIKSILDTASRNEVVLSGTVPAHVRRHLDEKKISYTLCLISRQYKGECLLLLHKLSTGLHVIR